MATVSALILPFGDVSPIIHLAAWLAPTATVIGQATIAADASVFFGAVVRADMDSVELGVGSNLQDNVVVHTDFGFPARIGAGVSGGHAAVVHGCTVEDDCLIGMGAILLNGARIGAGCIVGANALVTENKEFPDNSLIVGAPAKAVRTLDGAAAEKLRASAAHYVANWRRFAAGLKRIG